MVFFLALRNITRHKKDSAVVLLLIGIITFLFFIGNSVIANADRNIRQAFIESLTGDVVLQKTGDVTMNLFGANTPVIDEYFTVPVFPAYETVMDLVSNEPGIAGLTSQVSGKAFLDMLNVREPVLLCGIDAATYFSLFPGIILEEGRHLQAGEYGAMITAERAHRITAQSGQRPEIGMPMLFTSGGAMGFKIREVPLVGIFHYQNPGHFMNEIVIIDPQTVRVLNSIQVADDAEIDDASLVFFSLDYDALFDDAFFSDGIADDTEFSPDFLQHYLSSTRADTGAAETGGDWNFIIMRLKRGVSADSFIAALNKKIEPFGVTAVNWRVAAGTSAILSLLIQALFNSGIFLASVVGIIAIINILLISVFRRVREIGTLRAIGASNGYVRSLIYCENLCVSFIAGFAGVFAGGLFLRWINGLGITVTNELIISIMNGSVLQFAFLPHIAVFSFFVAALLGFAASIYPVETAVKIEPVVCINRG
jgi:ABC-type lipoprotein release transport system permease subunit